MIKVRLVKTNTSQRLHRSSWGDNMSEVLEQTSLEKVLTHYWGTKYAWIWHDTYYGSGGL